MEKKQENNPEVSNFVAPKGKMIAVRFALRGGQVFVKGVNSIEDGVKLMEEIKNSLGRATFFIINSLNGPNSMIRLDEIQLMNFTLVPEKEFLKWIKA